MSQFSLVEFSWVLVGVQFRSVMFGVILSSEFHSLCFMLEICVLTYQQFHVNQMLDYVTLQDYNKDIYVTSQSELRLLSPI